MNNNVKLKEISIFAKQEADRWRKSFLIIEKDTELFIEATILSAYSCELYLKTMLLFNGVDIVNDKKYHKHDLNFLFYNIDVESQKYIRSKIKLVPKNIVFDDGTEIKLENFDSYLNYASDTFESLRYEFSAVANLEHRLIFRKFIKNFNSLLKEACDRLFES